MNPLPEPTKEQVEVALQTINDIGVFAAIHSAYTAPVPELIAVLNWLKQKYGIEEA